MKLRSKKILIGLSIALGSISLVGLSSFAITSCSSTPDNDKRWEKAVISEKQFNNIKAGWEKAVKSATSPSFKIEKIYANYDFDRDKLILGFISLQNGIKSDVANYYILKPSTDGFYHYGIIFDGVEDTPNEEKVTGLELREILNNITNGIFPS